MTVKNSWSIVINKMLSLQLQTLPDSPGVYQFFDSSDTIIYVGKAKNLKKRVSSYFNKEHDSPKTRVLVSKIVRIEHIVVATENDALLLENNLIKKYQRALSSGVLYPKGTKGRKYLLWPLYQYQSGAYPLGFDQGSLSLAQL